MRTNHWRQNMANIHFHIKMCWTKCRSGGAWVHESIGQKKSEMKYVEPFCTIILDAANGIRLISNLCSGLFFLCDDSTVNGVQREIAKGIDELKWAIWQGDLGVQPQIRYSFRWGWEYESCTKINFEFRPTSENQLNRWNGLDCFSLLIGTVHHFFFVAAFISCHDQSNILYYIIKCERDTAEMEKEISCCYSFVLLLSSKHLLTVSVKNHQIVTKSLYASKSKCVRFVLFFFFDCCFLRLKNKTAEIQLTITVLERKKSSSKPHTLPKSIETRWMAGNA